MLYVKFVCVKLMYVKFVCVKLLYVKFIVVYVRRREEEKEPGIQNQKQEPHTKIWGKNILDRIPEGILDKIPENILNKIPNIIFKKIY